MGHVTRSVAVAIALAALHLAGHPATTAGASLPFSVNLEEVPLEGAVPGLHSFSVGVSGDRYLLIGGRTGGLHTFRNGVNNFPARHENRVAYVLSLPANSAKVLGSLDLARLGPDLCDPLSATNPQAHQVGDRLYIVGGYGRDSRTGEMTTFDAVTRVEISKMIDAILRAEADPARLKELVAQGHDPRLKVAGGALRRMGDRFHLIFGHTFDGAYTASLADYNRHGGMQQKYTEKVRVFELGDDLQVQGLKEVGPFSSDLPFNRRDLNVVPMIRPDGSQGLTAFGGVFMAGRVAAQLSAVDIDPRPGADPTVAVAPGGFKQALNHYDCPVLPLYDGTSGTMYATFFGGISQFHYDEDTGKLVRDPVDLDKGLDGLPFIDTITTIARGPDGPAVQSILPIRMPGLMGASAALLPIGSVPAYANGVVRLGELRGLTPVGYLFGGIASTAPYSVNGETFASAKLFRIWVSSTPTRVIPAPPLP